MKFMFSLGYLYFQPVGFVTFSSRVAAEAAKQDLQVRVIPPPYDTTLAQFAN